MTEKMAQFINNWRTIALIQGDKSNLCAKSVAQQINVMLNELQEILKSEARAQVPKLS